MPSLGLNLPGLDPLDIQQRLYPGTGGAPLAPTPAGETPTQGFSLGLQNQAQDLLAASDDSQAMSDIQDAGKQRKREIVASVLAALSSGLFGLAGNTQNTFSAINQIGALRENRARREFQSKQAELERQQQSALQGERISSQEKIAEQGETGANIRQEKELEFRGKEGEAGRKLQTEIHTDEIQLRRDEMKQRGNLAAQQFRNQLQLEGIRSANDRKNTAFQAYMKYVPDQSMASVFADVAAGTKDLDSLPPESQAAFSYVSSKIANQGRLSEANMVLEALIPLVELGAPTSANPFGMDVRAQVAQAADILTSMMPDEVAGSDEVQGTIGALANLAEIRATEAADSFASISQNLQKVGNQIDFEKDRPAYLTVLQQTIPRLARAAAVEAIPREQFLASLPKNLPPEGRTLAGVEYDTSIQAVQGLKQDEEQAANVSIINQLEAAGQYDEARRLRMKYNLLDLPTVQSFSEGLGQGPNP